MPQNIDRLSPTYDIPPGEVAELYEGPVTVTIGAHEEAGAGRVWFDWERAVRVSASGDGQVALAMGDDEASWSVSLPELGEVAIQELDSTATMPAAAWRLDAIAVADGGDLDADLIRVEFQLANFTVFFDGGAEEAPWRLLLDDDRWRVTIDQVEDASERLKDLRRIGGGAVMHAGRLEHPDGSLFTWSEAIEILQGLQLLLAFAAGDRVPALLPVGYDGDGNAVVYGLRSPRRESYKGRFRWCGPLLVGALADVWPRFVDLWEHADTKRMWKLAGELYVEAQHGDNLETRLVDAQSLLEVLAWDRLVRVGGRDPDDVDGHSADWRIRKMLAEIGAPEEVPNTMPETRVEWPGWDGPKVIAELRNSVVHPKDIQAILQLSATVKHDVVRLAMWYADLALLRLLDYDGNHHNRTETLPVPKVRARPSRGQRRDAGTHLGPTNTGRSITDRPDERPRQADATWAASSLSPDRIALMMLVDPTSRALKVTRIRCRPAARGRDDARPGCNYGRRRPRIACRPGLARSPDGSRRTGRAREPARGGRTPDAWSR